VQSLLRVSHVIDWINEKFGRFANVMVVLACVISAANAMIRYAFNISSNAWLEVQWYMFAAVVMLGASYTFKRNEHVRVDIFYLQAGERGQHWIDILGIVFFLLPACVLFTWLSWPFFMHSFIENEYSNNAGGLLRWPAKLLIPLGFVLLGAQGISELIKRFAALQGLITIESKYERPTQ